jgi:hypothetical protein
MPSTGHSEYYRLENNQPALAVTFTIVASFLASLPIIRHAWVSPREETWQFFAIDGTSGLLASLSIQTVGFLSLAFPLYVVLDDALIAIMIISQRRQQPNRRLA